MNGGQVDDVIFGDRGLIHSLKPGSGIIITATIKASEIREVARQLQGSKIQLIDSPVSGGFPGHIADLDHDGRRIRGFIESIYSRNGSRQQNDTPGGF